MSSLSNTSIRYSPDTWQAALRLIAGFALLWALAAALLFFAAPGLGTFGRLLLFQECGGTAIVVCALLIRRSRRFAKASPIIRWLVTGVIAVPTGYIVGHVLTFLILGEPIRFVGDGQDRMVPLVFTLLLTGFGLYFFATREQLASEAAVRSEAQRLATESQLRMLRAQLEPHMLFNTLANLRSLLSEDPKQAEVMIDRLIIYLRSALAASRTELTTLRREFTQLRAYLDIMSVRMGPRLTYRLELPAALDQTNIPPMLLQPLLENAIRHGIEPKVGKGNIEVIARRTQAGIEISVTDSGIGLPPEGEPPESSDTAGDSYGLLHVRERLAVIYGEQASLILNRRAPSGVCAVVSIPA
jgi:signal transduction histidine kinase